MNTLYMIVMTGVCVGVGVGGEGRDAYIHDKILSGPCILSWFSLYTCRFKSLNHIISSKQETLYNTNQITTDNEYDKCQH